MYGRIAAQIVAPVGRLVLDDLRRHVGNIIVANGPAMKCEKSTTRILKRFSR